MKILMTGGSGLIGQRFIHQHPEHQYTVVTRSIKKSRKKLPEQVSLVESLDTFKDLNTFDVVINLAGEPIADKRWSKKQKHKICQSRWQVTDRLVNLINQSTTPPHTFLSGSAIGLYGHTGEKIITEQYSNTEDSFSRKVCETWESIASQARRDTRVVYLRTGVVLSKQGGALRKMLPPFRLFLGGPIGKGEQWLSWIHVDDMIKAMDFLITGNLVGGVNMTSPEPVTNQTFSRSLAKACGTFSWLPVPAFALKVLMGESASLVLNSQKIMPDALTRAGFQFDYPQIDAALDNLLKKK